MLTSPSVPIRNVTAVSKLSALKKCTKITRNLGDFSVGKHGKALKGKSKYRKKHQRQ